MPVQEVPYFMQNEEWYTFNEDEWKYELTSLAPQEAIDSYKKFYADDFKTNKNGDIYILNEDDNEESQAMDLFGLQGGTNNNGQ